MSKHMKHEDSDTLESIQDCEYPCKHNGVLVDSKETKDPRESQERKKDDRGFDSGPTQVNRGQAGRYEVFGGGGGGGGGI